MSYVKSKELGYDKEQTIVIPIDNNDFYDHMVTFKNELQAKNNIASVSMMSGEPGGFFDQHTFEAEGQRDVWKARTEFADFEIVKTLGLKIIAGRISLRSMQPTQLMLCLLIVRLLQISAILRSRLWVNG
jgi:putative ABC transport system permease protein